MALAVFTIVHHVIAAVIILNRNVQGDTSGCLKPSVDIELQVVFSYKVLILKRNFHINVKEVLNYLMCHPVESSRASSILATSQKESIPSYRESIPNQCKICTFPGR